MPSASVSVLAAIAAIAAAPPAKLTVKTSELVVTLEAKSSFTIRSLDYQGVRLIVPAGGQGAVVAPRSGSWVGSAMGKDVTEPVLSFDVEADKTETGADAAMVAQGDRVTLKKQSTLAGLGHVAVTTIGPDRFVQRHAFVAEQDVDLRSFYAFIYSFTPKAQQWAAQPLSGPVRKGAFKGDKGHVPGAACRWLAQYDPATQKGALVYFQTPFSGRGATTHFWDTAHYHKLIAQPLRGKIKKGTKLDCTLVVKCFAAEPDAWMDCASRAADALGKEFPPVMPAPTESNKKRYGEGVPEQGDMLCKTAHYAARFVARAAWTIHQIDFDGQPIAEPTGWYGTVMVPKGGRWWGTGHTEGGEEIVHALKLTVDGKEQPVKPGGVVEGSKITLLKDSTIWKLKAHVEVTLTDDHIYERTRLTAVEDCEQKLMYYFMHCFVPSTTAWAAELPEGSFETGALDHNKGFSVNKDTRWVAQYEPNMGLGILCYTPKVIAGPRSCSKIWNQPRYHKYYIQQNLGQALKKGDVLDFDVIVQAVPGETGDWAATKAAVAKLREAYAPVE